VARFSTRCAGGVPMFEDPIPMPNAPHTIPYERWAMGGGRGAPHAVGFPRRCCQQTN